MRHFGVVIGRNFVHRKEETCCRFAFNITYLYTLFCLRVNLVAVCNNLLTFSNKKSFNLILFEKYSFLCLLLSFSCTYL